MNFRAIFLSMQRVLGIFSRRENDVVELIKQAPSSLSPFAQIVGDQKYTVPDHPNLEVLKFIEYPTRPAGIQTFNEQSILSLYRDKLHSISMMLAISDGDIREDAFTFTNLVLKPLIEYIRWIHLLPASENHHHNGIGGLLSHSLEVAMISLKMPIILNCARLGIRMKKSFAEKSISMPLLSVVLCMMPGRYMT